MYIVLAGHVASDLALSITEVILSQWGALWCLCYVFPTKLVGQKPESWMMQPPNLSKVWDTAFEVMSHRPVFTNCYSFSFHSETLFGETPPEQVGIFSLLFQTRCFDVLCYLPTTNKLIKWIFLLKGAGHKEAKRCVFCVCLHVWIVLIPFVIPAGSR